MGAVTASPDGVACAAAAAPPRRGPRRGGGAAAGGGAEGGGEGDRQASSADLDDDRLPPRLRSGVGVVEAEGLDGVVPFGFDPAGVDAELVGGEGGVVDDEAVKRQHGGHAFDVEFGQGAPGAL
jgi:hypothetical protein